MTTAAIDRYIAALRARAGMALDDDVAEELRGHLEDAANDLQMRGLDPAESAREAVRRFGPPDELGPVFARAHRTRRPLPHGPRSLVAALVVASLLAVLGGSAGAAARAPQKVLVRHAHHIADPTTARAATTATENHR